MNNMKLFRYLFFLALPISFHASGQALTQKSFDNPNSPYDEQAPIISPDGKVLYWTVANHPLNIGGKRDPGDIW
ncbi:MAG: PD40 domain-containing protein, partial [Cyclobacteriaceae bacterium]|nr:PD40 domain-containing protein [Cyclobacteriaceae bacterium]